MKILCSAAAVLFFCWVFNASLCLYPEVAVTGHSPPPEFTGEPGWISLVSTGGLRPPDKALFAPASENADVDTAFPPDWKITGISWNGFVRSCGIEYWYLKIGTYSGAIGTYLPGNLVLEVPEARVIPRSSPVPVLLEEEAPPPGKFWLCMALAAVLLNLLLRIGHCFTPRRRLLRRLNRAQSFGETEKLLLSFIRMPRGRTLKEVSQELRRRQHPSACPALFLAPVLERGRFVPGNNESPVPSGVAKLLVLVLPRNRKPRTAHNFITELY